MNHFSKNANTKTNKALIEVVTIVFDSLTVKKRKKRVRKFYAFWERSVWTLNFKRNFRLNLRTLNSDYKFYLFRPPNTLVLSLVFSIT